MTGTTKQTTTNEPPAWAKGLFERSARVTNNLYDDNVGFHSWQGDTTAGPSWQTRQGIEGLSREANQGQGLQDAATGQTMDVLNRGGLSSNARNAIGGVYQAGTDTTPSAAQKYYTGMAKGDMLTGNPFYDAALQSETDKVADQVNASFAGAGRYGSGAHTGVLANELADTRVRALNENFGRERGYQMQAIEGLTGDENSRFGRRLQAAQTGAGLESQGSQNALSYLNALPTVQQNRLFDENLLLQSGAMTDQQNQATLNDRIRRFTENDMRPITRLGFLQSAASGSAGPYGTSSTVSKQPFNPLSLLSGLFGLFG